MTANYVTLTGTVPDAAGATATFTPSGWLTDSGSDLLIAPASNSVTLNGSGQFSVSLFATDNVPAPWFWTVTFSGINGVPAYSFPFYLAYANGATQDISNLAPGNGSDGIALLAGAQFTGYLAPAVSDLTDGADIAVNAALGNDFRLTLGGDHLLSNPTNPLDGQTIKVQVTQGGSGSSTLSYGTAYLFSSGLPSPTLSTAAGDLDLLEFCYNAALAKWLLIRFVKGFA
jgi:hypothetical protein